jgi:hypothetical protein
VKPVSTSKGPRQNLIPREETVRRVHDRLVVGIAPIKTPDTGSYGLKRIGEDLLGKHIPTESRSRRR